MDDGNTMNGDLEDISKRTLNDDGKNIEKKLQPKDIDLRKKEYDKFKNEIKDFVDKSNQNSINANLFENITNVFELHKSKMYRAQLAEVCQYTEELFEKCKWIEDLPSKEKSMFNKKIETLHKTYSPLPNDTLNEQNQQIIKLTLRYMDPLVLCGSIEKPKDNGNGETLFYIIKFTRNFCCHMSHFLNYDLLLHVHSNIRHLYYSFGLDLNEKIKMKEIIYDTKEFNDIYDKNKYFYRNSCKEFLNFDTKQFNDSKNNCDIECINSYIHKKNFEISEKESYSHEEQIYYLFGSALYFLVATRDTEWKKRTKKFSKIATFTREAWNKLHPKAIQKSDGKTKLEKNP